ncbi:MAG: hypothetical protein U0V45_05530 [Flavobacteriales bacterium]|jgi:hypothetical protein
MYLSKYSRCHTAVPPGSSPAPPPLADVSPAAFLHALIRRPVNDFQEATIRLIVHPSMGWNSTCTWFGITHQACKV